MIEIVDVWKSFGRNHVLRGVDIKIEQGETLVIIGRSGCGKSVLLKSIMGIIRPDKGKILVDGRDLLSLPEAEQLEVQKRIQILFQGAALFDSLTVSENVGFLLSEHTKMPQKEIDEIVAAKLALVGLQGIQHLKPAELSGGMKKRVGLARAICNDPAYILYDEPTTGIDPIMADAINELILDLHKKLKVTSVVVTHDMASAYKVASRMAMMYEGRIIAVGTPDEIRNSENPYVKQFIAGSMVGPIKVK